MLNKLSTQVGILFFLGMTLILGLFSWFEYQKEARHMRFNAESKATDSASLIAAHISNDVLYQKSFPLWQQMKHIQQQFVDNHDIVILEFAILDKQQRVLTHSNPKQYPVMQIMPLPDYNKVWEKNKIHIEKNILHPSDGRFIGYLFITFDAHAIQQALVKLQQDIALSFFLALIVSIVLAIGMSYRVSFPLKQLALLSEHIGTGQLSITDFAHTPHEIKQLAQAIQHADQSIHQKSQALFQSETLLKDVLDHSPAVIFIKDTQGKYILINKRYAELFHTSNEEIIGLTDTDIFDHDTANTLRQHDLHIIESGEAKIIEETVPDDRGDRCYYSLKFPLRDANNTIYAICGIATDVTEQNKTTSQVNKLATIIKQTDDIVIVTDKNGLIEYVNPAFERISGYSAHEVIGKTPGITKSNRHSSSYYQAMWASLHAGKTWRGHFTNRNKMGHEYEVSLSITPIINSAGDITGFSSTQRDVTYQRKIQLKLQHTDRVESLGILAGGIAHDFNNLLTAILGNASLACNKIDATSPIRSHLDAIERASHSAADLCKQMLAYSGKGKFVVKAIHLSELVDHMGKLIEVSLAKSVVLKYHLSKNLPTIEADVAQIQQIILNLITNASEAIDEQSGVISMSTGVMHADHDYLNGCIGDEHLEPGRYVYLEVSDTGCGMDIQTQHRIFDPFFTTKFTGRGLGMSAMLGIVKGHHGGLRIYSELGQGTSIKVVFPISKQQNIPLNDNLPSISQEPQFSGLILVIDDEETVREVACVMLESMGFQTITAHDGVMGIELFREYQDKITLVLLDMTMPNMDGNTCFRELRRMKTDVRVMLSSGYNEQDATNRFSGKGLAGFLQKPYSPKQLTEKIKEILSCMS